MNLYIILANFMFAVGVFGLITRRNLIAVLISVELIFNAANINFAVASKLDLIPKGDVFVLFVIAVAACEVAVALALAIAIYKNSKKLKIEELNYLKG
ncbi:MAG: NADH-quinone oxidoreductase subunit NuoK [bacterium]|nr:NADH-quinone oxidoreductase subunit NuoK [bacterium]